MRFCGETFGTVKCSIESHCPTGKECPDGETCFTNERCNVHDLIRIRPSNPPSSLKLPSTSPGRETSLSSSAPDQPTHTPTSKRKATNPSLRPSSKPTAEVIEPSNIPSRTQRLESTKWCGKSQTEADMNCGTRSMPCSNNSCPFGRECFLVDEQFCVSVSANDKQTMSPASSPTEGSERPSNGLPQGKSSIPIQSTNDPAQYLSTEKPTNAYYASTEDIIETIVSTTAPTETKPTYYPTKRIPGNISEEPSSDLSRATG